MVDGAPRRTPTRQGTRRRLGLLILSCVVLGVPPARATDLHDVITDITITSWNEKDGLPGSTIWALAQDQNGYLWVGTRQGLLRFDGVRFTPWESFNTEQLPDRWIRSLLVTPRGDMWIGFGGDGLVARFADGRLTAFKGPDAPTGTVVALVESRDGTVWAGTEKGLYAFDGARWTRWESSRGVPDGAVVSLYEDRQGRLYVAAGTLVTVRRSGEAAFEPAEAFADAFGSFAEDSSGTVWVTDPRLGYRSFGANSPPASTTRQGRGIRVLVDRKGNLWTGTGGQGLWRTRGLKTPTSTTERASSLTGLLGDGVYSLLEDRDGNIWAGTTEGLNRITPRTIEQIIDIGLVRGVAVAPDGRVWVSTVDRVYAYAAKAARRVDFRIPAEARALAADSRGLWTASSDGVSYLHNAGRTSEPAWLPARDAGHVDAMAADGGNGLWLVSAESSIAHWNGRSLQRVPLPPQVQGARVTAAFVDSRRRAWFAFANGRIGAVAGNQRVDLIDDTLDIRRVIRTMAEDASGRLWLGGDGILAALESGRLMRLETSRRFPLTSITAIVTDDRGTLWLGSPGGIAHMSRDEFDRAANDETAAPVYSVYSRSDGVAGTPVAIPFNRGAVRALDGRLWFVTTRGITVLDPHVLEVRNTPLTVRFEGALADGRRLAPGREIVLPPGTRQLEVDYTVVNLTSPLKTRFRYRLDPFDPDWVEAGSRRQAFYTNLKPGRYAFRVSAAGGVGASSTEASWGLTVEPRFYQTRTFALLSAAAFGLLVLCGWQVRERQLRNQFRILISERARLGREIHDTLLQGLVAIALQFDSLAHELAPMPRLQERFYRLRDRVEDYIREARRSIWDLHTQPPHRDLVESLRRSGEFAIDGRDISFAFRVQGTPYECPPQVQEQVVRIAQEASLNAVRHASPKRLQIDLAYDDAAVTLTVADDGRGFDSQQARGADHFGIRSMQERARSVGGVLTLNTAPGRGTEVVAVLPIAS